MFYFGKKKKGFIWEKGRGNNFRGNNFFVDLKSAFNYIVKNALLESNATSMEELLINLQEARKEIASYFTEESFKNLKEVEEEIRKFRSNER